MKARIVLTQTAGLAAKAARVTGIKTATRINSIVVYARKQGVEWQKPTVSLPNPAFIIATKSRISSTLAKA